MFVLPKVTVERWILGLIACSFLFRLFSLGTVNLLVEEAYYWNYSAHLDWSYLDHPPLVALLIKLSTSFLGTTEWAVRLPSMICWVLMAGYSYRLTILVGEKGWVAVFLLSILPFFFLQSWVMTPDQPLLVAWSALLYYLYRACVLNQNRAWFSAGIALGLGLLSKYTIVLLVPATLLFLCLSARRRFWFFRIEPYAALLCAGVLFSPVLYWNATHDWISFTFQSSRRLNEVHQCSIHVLFGLLILFLMPVGVKGLWRLCRVSSVGQEDTLLFFKCMLVLPLIFFACFSVFHAVKFNWIGPSLLALIPWLSREFKASQKAWGCSAILLMSMYSLILVIIARGQPTSVYQLLFSKYMNWQQLSETIFEQLESIEHQTHTQPVMITLDKYNIASEFAFYQAKLHPKHTYAIRGSDVYGGESLMYRYWGEALSPMGQTRLLVTDNARHFNNPAIVLHATTQSSIQSWTAVSQGASTDVKAYFYRIIR